MPALHHGQVSVNRLDPGSVRQAINQLNDGAAEFRVIVGRLRAADAPGWSGGSHDAFRKQTSLNAGYLETTAGIRESAAVVLGSLLPAWEALKSAWQQAATTYNSASLWSPKAGVSLSISGSCTASLADGTGIASLDASARQGILQLRVDVWKTAEGIKFRQTQKFPSGREAFYEPQIRTMVSKRERKVFQSAEAAAWVRLVDTVGAAIDTYARSEADVAATLDQLTAKIPAVIAAKRTAAGKPLADPVTYANALALQHLSSMSRKDAAGDKAILDRLSDPTFQALLVGSLPPEDLAKFYGALTRQGIVSSIFTGHDPAESASFVLDAVEKYGTDEQLAGFVGALGVVDLAEMVADMSTGEGRPLDTRLGLAGSLRWLEMENNPSEEFWDIELHPMSAEDPGPDPEYQRLDEARLKILESAIDAGYEGLSASEFASVLIDGEPVSAFAAVLASYSQNHHEFGADLVLAAPYLTEPYAGENYIGLNSASPTTAALLMHAALQCAEKRDAVRGEYIKWLDWHHQEKNSDSWNQARAAIYLDMIDLPEEYANLKAGQAPAHSISTYPHERLKDLLASPKSAAILALGIPLVIEKYAKLDMLHALGLHLERSADNTREEFMISSPYTAFLHALDEQFEGCAGSAFEKVIGRLKPDDWGDLVQNSAISFLIGEAMGGLKLNLPMRIAFAAGEFAVDAAGKASDDAAFKKVRENLEILLNGVISNDERYNALDEYFDELKVAGLLTDPRMEDLKFLYGSTIIGTELDPECKT